MHPDRRSQPEERGQDLAVVHSPRCPFCAGLLLLLRDLYFCNRCRFSLCAGCEGADGCAVGAD
jgi:hypothetical protein